LWACSERQRCVAGDARNFFGREILLRQRHRLDDAELHVEQPRIDHLLCVDHGHLRRDTIGHAAEVVVHVKSGGVLNLDATGVGARRVHPANLARTALGHLDTGAED